MSEELPNAVLDEAYAMDAEITADRSPEAQQARVDAVAAAVAEENAGAPSEDEVEALYVGEPLPEPEVEADELPVDDAG